MARHRNNGRVPFDFRQRVTLARIYLDDGALHTCAARLESLAADIRAAASERDDAMGLTAARKAGAI